MRNNTLHLAILASLFAMVAGVSLALEEQAPRQQEQKTSPPENQPASEPSVETPAQEADAEPAEGQESEDAGDPQAPERFVPSQKTSADNSATFPVDI